MSLRRRIALGGLIAVLVATSLHFYLRRERDLQSVTSPASAWRQKMALDLGRGVPRGRPWLVYLCFGQEAERLHEQFAPVVEIRPGGAVDVLRGVPRPDGPEVNTGWLAAAVKLPQASLRELSDRERAQFLAVLGAWQVRSTRQFGQKGTQFRRSELKGLLHWLR